MNRIRFFISALSMMLIACSSINDKNTIANLRHMKIEIKEEKIEGGLDKAMSGYQHFLEETPDSALRPEAIRRLADLKIEKEYGTLTPGYVPARQAPARSMPAAPCPVKPGDAAGRGIAAYPGLRGIRSGF
jgi:hypothetical protein